MANVKNYNCSITKSAIGFYFHVANGIETVRCSDVTPETAQAELEATRKMFADCDFRAFDSENEKWVSMEHMDQFPKTLQERVELLEKENAQISAILHDAITQIDTLKVTTKNNAQEA